ncbi:26S proteasome non-ATPase regulatory subunit 14 [Perkinsela sp. CCAP 1560/4]|nr:26S proteasome non-ATPase regulatory subunit 14 [Perkinsela sp. CCAP 1560/4]|eukprot:KNH09611.1 26S proteasome non-ATPase regulatory subunit 14 [Perkinsela sp. CCAP 1560/4]
MDIGAILQQLNGSGASAGDFAELPCADTAETIQISSLALLKMLIHGRAGVPMEVMGLMIGDFIDEYTVRVIDVFSMPQSGTGVSVEAVDPEYQAAMLNKLEPVGRPQNVVGWYHSHPGFGCWLSHVDVNTAQSFEQLNARSVSVVIDPIQSVRGKVVIDAFRCIPQQYMITGKDARQTTSNIGFSNKPTIQALIHNLNRQYYSMPITYRKNEHETRMLLNVHKSSWKEGLVAQNIKDSRTYREEKLRELKNITKKCLADYCDSDKTEKLNAIRKNLNNHTRHVLSELQDSIVEQNIRLSISCLAYDIGPMNQEANQ